MGFLSWLFGEVKFKDDPEKYSVRAKTYKYILEGFGPVRVTNEQINYFIDRSIREFGEERYDKILVIVKLLNDRLAAHPDAFDELKSAFLYKDMSLERFADITKV
jgi:hypothetical protein